MARFLHGTNQAPTSSRSPSIVSVGRKERLNGWSCPWHPLQFIAWFFIVFFAIVYFGIFVPHLPAEWTAAGYIIPGGLLLVHLIFHLAALSIDPADRNIRGTYFKDKPSFDRNLHAHVIENNHCHICETDVCSTSKHCSVCNKCISDFDHHCKWLNTCVGGRNYKLFIGCVASGFILALVLLAFDMYLFIIFFVSKTDLLQTQSDRKLKLFVPVDEEVFVVFVGIVAGLLLAAIALLGHLLGFHIYIMCLNISTYDYIVNSREKKETDLEAGCETPVIRKRSKNNKIRPIANVPDRSEATGNEDVTDNEQSIASTENSNEPSVKIMNEVSSKAIKRHDSPPVTDKVEKASRDSSQSPGIVLHSTGFTNHAIAASSEESLNERSPEEPPEGPPVITVEPPSDCSRPSTSSPRRPLRSYQSQNDTSRDVSQSNGDTSSRRGMTSAKKGNSQSQNDTSRDVSQSNGDTSSRRGMTSHPMVDSIRKDAEISSQGITSSIGELADDSEEDLVPVTQIKTVTDSELNQSSKELGNIKKKKYRPKNVDKDNDYTELNASQNKGAKKKKKKKSKTPEPMELPPLASRRPLPSLGAYGQGDDIC